MLVDLADHQGVRVARWTHTVRLVVLTVVFAENGSAIATVDNLALISHGDRHPLVLVGLLLVGFEYELLGLGVGWNASGREVIHFYALVSVDHYFGAELWLYQGAHWILFACFGGLLFGEACSTYWAVGVTAVLL